MDGRDIFSGYVRPQAFTEYFLDSSNGLGRPTWASIRSSTRQYTEYYDTAGAVTFREYYDMVNDPYQLVNLLGDGNPANDPSYASLSTQLAPNDSALAALACDLARVGTIRDRRLVCPRSP